MVTIPTCIKTTVFPKQFCRLKTFPISTLFCEYQQTDSKYHTEKQKTQRMQLIIEGEESLTLTLFDFKTYNKARVIKIV